MCRKRWLSAALVFLCLMSVAPARADQGAAPSGFTDMTGHWAQEIVAKATAAGYVNGYPDGTFRPGMPVSRAELLKLIGAATGARPEIHPESGLFFPDLGPEHWLVKQGYAAPQTLRAVRDLWSIPADQPLDVNRPVRRWEVAALAAWVEVAGELNPVEGKAALQPFPDLREWHQPAGPWVGLAAAHGLIGGYPDGTFRPEEPVSRVEAVVILERLRHSTWRQDPAGLLAAGSSHVLAIKPDGSVWGWGTGHFGALGTNTSSVQEPVRINGVDNPRSVAVGRAHSLALMSDGTVLAWGYNEYGQLGDDTRDSRPAPDRVRDLNDVIAVAAGLDHSLALRANGTVWGWGYNFGGQLGDTTNLFRMRPIQAAGLSGVTAIAAGSRHSLALKADGTVWAWGQKDTNAVYNADLSPVEITGLPRIQSIAAAGDQSVALAEDGSVWQWGTSSCTQVGTLTPWKPERVPALSGAVAVAAGRCHAAALKSDGTVWTWGFNEAGQLGDGTITDRIEPVQVPGLAPVRAIYANRDYTLVVAKNGELWAWGDYHGNVGGLNGPSRYRHEPTPVPGVPKAFAVSAGAEQSLALTDGGQVYAWGRLSLFRPGYRWRRNAVLVPGLPPAKGIAAGKEHALVLLEDGTVATWGSNQQGQAGAGSIEWVYDPRTVVSLSDITAVAAGPSFSLALQKNGQVWAFGQNELGQLGDGTKETRTRPAPVQGITDITAVATGRAHALALQRDGTLWSWGDNQFGQLGNASTVSSAIPVRVSGLGKVIAIAASDTGSLALTEDGAVWTWGEAIRREDNSYGAGPVRVEDIPPLTAISAGGAVQQYFSGVTADGRHFEWYWFGMYDGLVHMSAATENPTLKAFVTLSRGSGHTLAIKADGSVWAWGSNDWDKLGLAQTTPMLASDLNLGAGSHP